MSSKRLSLGNVSTQPFGLADDSAQERLRLSFLAQLRACVSGCGSVTDDGKARTNEQMRFCVTPFPNLRFDVLKIGTRLQSGFPGCTVDMRENQLICMLPCARKGTGPNHVAYHATYVLSHVAVLAACVALLYILPRGSCYV